MKPKDKNYITSKLRWHEDVQLIAYLCVMRNWRDNDCPHRNWGNESRLQPIVLGSDKYTAYWTEATIDGAFQRCLELGVEHETYNEELRWRESWLIPLDGLRDMYFVIKASKVKQD
jgi:hypothetical protein